MIHIKSYIKPDKLSDWAITTVKAAIEALELNIRKSRSITIQIKEIPQHIKGNFLGFIETGYTPEDVYELFLDTEQTKPTLKLVIAHEIIHFKQYVKHELKRVAYKHFKYKNEDYFVEQYDKQAPWEVEAYSKQNDIKRKMSKILKEYKNNK